MDYTLYVDGIEENSLCRFRECGLCSAAPQCCRGLILRYVKGGYVSCIDVVAGLDRLVG